MSDINNREDERSPADDQDYGLDYMTKGSSNHRLIFINRPQPFKFCSNKISTAKYNFLSFSPSFLFEQFRRYSNCFFLLIALLQQIPDVSPTGRYTTLVPLIFILLISAVKEIIEDIRRHRADREINHREVEVIRNSQWRRTKWKDVLIGEIVKVYNNHFFPSDLLVLSTSEPQGMCYIETMNLDGETNLKVRQALPDTSMLINTNDLLSLKGVVECDLPNKLIYDFTGTLTESTKSQILPLGPDQILLRGAMLRNTAWIYGVVIYTGHDTKLMQNSTSAPLKRSTVDKQTNGQIVMLFILLLCLCLVSTICSIVWSNSNNKRNWYLGLEDEPLNTNVVFTMLTFIILYNNLIPISLQVTLEVVRYLQAAFINTDLDMYYAPTDTPAAARTSNLNEELGMVRYIFSDKTGTLTQNVMVFKHCSIAGILFTEDMKSSLMDMLLNDCPNSSTAHHFLTLMSVCHTVIPEKVPNSDDMIYHASSPDERALVFGAKSYDFIFDTRTPHTVEVVQLSTRKQYEILNVLDFTSTRKRMSVIVRNPDRKIILYCKGADSVIFERLAENGQTFCADTLTHLKEFASLGLRTLCFSMTEIAEDTYYKWNVLYREAATSMDDREKKLEDVANMIETNLYLLGATAVEDKLQDKVPEAIESLLKAGISVWVLTGDKQETAINIGYSTRLIAQGAQVITLNETTTETLQNSIMCHLTNMKDAADVTSVSQRSLVIDGKSLKFALSKEMSRDFLKLCFACKSVICCRVSPMQKAEVVELVRNNTNEVTLSIGDGANDVAMIQKAHVGIGISGVEGLQAACASDYSIAQFHFLLKLLFVHGNWNYDRMCKLILYSFYKNICLYVMELWFAIYSGWSGQILFERWTIGLYNVLFTAAPPLVIGIFDKTNSAEMMMKYPKLYSYGPNRFSVQIFWCWILNALLHSMFMYWLPMLSVTHDVIWSNGREGGYLVMGNMIYTYVVVVVCMKAGIHMSSWTWLTHATIWGSVIAWFTVLLIYSHFWPVLPFGVVMLGMDQMIATSLVFWFGFLFIPITLLSIDMIVLSIFNLLWGNSITIIFEDEIAANNHPTNSDTTIEPRNANSERAGLLRSVRSVFTFFSDGSRSNAELEMNHGFAFSQEEGGAVSQSQVVRAYNTNIAKA